MPPKKKKGKKKKKKKDDGVLTVEDQYKKTLEEMDVLKDHLAVRKELSRRSQAQSEEWKERMKETETSLTNNQDLQKAISADMTRQYKTMQTEMGLRIHQLETELARTRAHLDSTEANLRHVQEEKEQMEKDKDAEIEDLKMKIDTMGMQYEHILHDTLDKLGEKMDAAKNLWEGQAEYIQLKNKQTLREFGIKHLEI